jgi:hypothetical protein
MSGKKRFVDGDVLERGDAFVGHDFKYPVDQEEGITMR